MPPSLTTNAHHPRIVLRYWRFAVAFTLGSLLVVDFWITPRWITTSPTAMWRYGQAIATLAALGALSWPWATYRIAWNLCLWTGLGLFAPFMGDLVFRLMTRSPLLPGSILVIATTAASVAVVSGIALTLAVWCRRRWWPVRTEGFCVTCGYCLRGLTSSRCPECGTGFESVDSRGLSAGTSDQTQGMD